jgi:hypothetical protein
MKKKSKEKALWWSSFNTYEDCGQQFLWKYGVPGIELGGGLGKPKPKPTKRSEHHMVMGKTIQYAIECLYNDHLWKKIFMRGEGSLTPQELSHQLAGIARERLLREIGSSHILWRESPSHAELEDLCVNGVVGYLKTMVAHRLVGDYSRAEKFLSGAIPCQGGGPSSVAVGARVDMIIRRSKPPREGITILDGKNSKYRGKYTDHDQLKFYALVFYLGYRRLPDHLGFVYYRFPAGTPLEESPYFKPSVDFSFDSDPGVDWIPVDRNDIRSMAQRVVAVRQGIFRGDFDPDPEPSKCRFCDWEKVCESRQAQKEENRRKRKVKKITLPPIESGDGFDDGFIEVE